jgi:hypothetical protein
MRGMYLHAERLLAKAGRQGAMRRGIAHPQRSGGQAQRSDFSQKNYGETSCRRARAAPSAKVWFPYACASAHRTYQGRVAAGTGRCGGWRKTRERLETGKERSSSLRAGVLEML